jgi:hypothetical protein
MTKKQKKEAPDFDLAYKGMIPWSTKEFFGIYAKFSTQKIKKANERANKGDLLAETFQKEYPNVLEFTAHLHRFRLIRMFIFQYGRQLGKDGFYAPQGEAGFRNELIDILCALPYSKEEKDPDGEKFYTFSYPQVKAAALKKINAHLN